MFKIEPKVFCPNQNFSPKAKMCFFLRMNDFLLLDLKLDPRVNKNPSGVKNVVGKLEIKNLDCSDNGHISRCSSQKT